MHLKAISTLSPSHECKQFNGFTKEIKGGSLLALRGRLNEFSSVTIVRASSKSANEGAEKEIARVTDMPGAMSPCTLDGYLILRRVKLSLEGEEGRVRGRRDEFNAAGNLRGVRNLYWDLVHTVHLVVNELNGLGLNSEGVCFVIHVS
jgi:hypothetical protein